jgi:tetratricopeptide (TPR) repeat protein
MDTLMKVASRAWKESWIVTACLVLALQPGLAQKKPATDTPDQTRRVLVDKAHALEARGRPDMSIQLWQQILLSDPKSTEALAGLARDYKMIGSAAQSDEALERLRKVNPNDPNIAKILAMTSTNAQSAQLRQAGELAKQGKSEGAMNIYRQLYGDHPPDGDIGLAYYQTLYGTPNGKPAAIAAMRAMAQRNSGDSRYSIELGRMLTFDAKTRPEGIRILKEHPKDSSAQSALRQALIWDSANPASAAELRQFLKDHPQDTEIAGHLKESEKKLAQMNSGIARTPDERAAFAALNAHKLDEAEARFTHILEYDPKNGRMAAGMGFLRMQQSNFGGAISYLTQAEENGYKAKTVEDALVASRFWYTMGEASQAFDENQLDVAAAKYRAALAIRPRSPEALVGMAGLLVKEQQYAAAAGFYEQLIKVQPGSTAGWRGLFLALARDGQNGKALAVSGRFPAQVKAAMAKDPEYLRTLATIYKAQNRPADAQRVLAQALALPFPANGANLKADMRLQYAGVLMEAKRFAQAADLYAQTVNEDPTNVSAWMGLVSAHHELGQDTMAISDVEKMPPPAYEAALADPGFLAMLGSIYAQANQFEIAQGFLERSAKMQIAAGGQPSVELQLQLAGIYLQRNNTAQAYEIYRQVLSGDSDRADAWKGLIGTLLLTNRNSEALSEIAMIPPAVRKQLETDIEFVQTEASLYAANGDTAHAMEYMNRVEAHYAKLKTQAPANIEVQNAWLLFNTKNDRLLYGALMRLGGRNDLTAAQRETVQDIWANWSVRRAGAAMDNGDIRRAVDILDAASQAFPDNMTVRKAVAGGYVRVGRAKEALALFKTVGMQDATAGDFQGAIGAALSANDKTMAEVWLRQALERYPRDPAILSLAARYEQARGDNQRAADYWRASLAAMPMASPAEKLAHTLVYPDQDMKAHRAVTAADLQHLLDPNYTPFAKTTKVAPLPAYGPDPYNGSAPVVPGPSHSAAQSAQQSPTSSAKDDAPWTMDNQAPSTQDSNPAVTAIPAAQPPNPQMFHRQSATSWMVADSQSTDSVPVEPGMQGSPSEGGSGMEENIHVLRLASYVGGAPALHMVLSAMPLGSSGEVQAVDQTVQLSANAPHSLASDAWKGLIFSLMANNQNTEALEEISKIPPEVRKQLEADVEFEQGEASLFVAIGDVPRAVEYLSRVENFYVLRRTPPPAGMEVQHAWLLYNIRDDGGLYPVLLRLDTRQDLSAPQRQEVDTLWANWAVRRAFLAMENGNLLRGVEILQAASADYPDNMNVRRAVAGAYGKVGRAADSLALFKTIPMDDASAGDFDAAIGAALGATDMAQAEAWLRIALGRYPNDPQILGLAARFEQARGNSQRATDFWRASLAAMPPGASVERLDSGLLYPPGTYKAPGPGDLKRMLDPRSEPPQRVTKTGALPSYGAEPSSRYLPSVPAPPASVPQRNQWIQAPSGNPLPLPAPQMNNPGTTPGPQSSVPNQQGETLRNAPLYVPQRYQSSGPVLIEQSATQEADFRPAIATSQAGKAVHPQAKPNGTQNSGGYAGKMQLPPGEENIDSTDPAGTGTAQGRQTPAWIPPAGGVTRGSTASQGLRISSQPMGPLAARVQALFAEQTDSQLTQGSATAIRAQRYVPAPGAPSVAPSASSQYKVAQYTPSAQEAATGAYSAKQTQQPQPAPQQQITAQQPAQQPVKPSPAKQTKKSKSKKARRAAAATQPSVAVVTPVAPPAQNLPTAQYPELPAATSTATGGTGLTDEELQQRNLPPLRGPWVRVQRESRALSPRDEAEMQLRSIESSYSAWLGGSGIVNHRSGSPGFDQLTALEAPFEISLAAGYHMRLTFVPKPVFLDSGQADGTSIVTVTTVGQTKTTTIPQPLGTLLTTDTTPPPQQNAAGMGGELQLVFQHFAVSAGYTPYGFLVSNIMGRVQWKPGNGPLTFNFVRDSVKDTQLSYSGLRDPGSASLSFPGNIWGGVMANQGGVQFAKGNAESGFYMGANGQYITGYNVELNTRFDGTGGAYWRLVTSPENGNLSIGANFFGMHYAHNEDAFTFGMGGYFSPQAYFLGNVPLTWVGHSGTQWHYTVMGSLGVQAFQEDLAALFPLANQKSIEVSSGNLALPAKTSVAANYDLRGQVAYAIGPHWFVGGFLGANNSRNYSAVSAGFSVRYLFRSQPSTVAGPTGLFPYDGVRPFTVP